MLCSIACFSHSSTLGIWGQIVKAKLHSMYNHWCYRNSDIIWRLVLIVVGNFTISKMFFLVSKQLAKSWAYSSNDAPSKVERQATILWRRIAQLTQWFGLFNRYFNHWWSLNSVYGMTCCIHFLSSSSCNKAVHTTWIFPYPRIY